MLPISNISKNNAVSLHFILLLLSYLLISNLIDQLMPSNSKLDSPTNNATNANQICKTFNDTNFNKRANLYQTKIYNEDARTDLDINT